jgi:hypothetical protein
MPPQGLVHQKCLNSYAEICKQRKIHIDKYMKIHYATNTCDNKNLEIIQLPIHRELVNKL